MHLGDAREAFPKEPIGRYATGDEDTLCAKMGRRGEDLFREIADNRPLKAGDQVKGGAVHMDERGIQGAGRGRSGGVQARCAQGRFPSPYGVAHGVPIDMPPHGGLEPAEAEIKAHRIDRPRSHTVPGEFRRRMAVRLDLDLRQVERDCERVAEGREGVHPGAAGVGQAEQLGDLVKSLAGGVVHRAADVAVAPETILVAVSEVEVAVAAGDHGGEQGTGVGEVLFGLEKDRLNVAFEVVDGDQGQIGAEGKRLGEADTHQQGAGEARAFRDGDGPEVAVVRDACPAHGFADDGDHVAQVLAAGKFGDDAAVVGVHQLRGDDVGKHGATVRDDGGGGLVAGAFDSEDEAGRQGCPPYPSQAGRHALVRPDVT